MSIWCRDDCDARATAASGKKTPNERSEYWRKSERKNIPLRPFYVVLKALFGIHGTKNTQLRAGINNE